MKKEEIIQEVENLNNSLSLIKKIDYPYFDKLINLTIKHKLYDQQANCYINLAHLIILKEENYSEALKHIKKVRKSISSKIFVVVFS